MNTQPDANWVDAALRLVDHDEWPPASETADDAACALGWAIKHLCYSSWSTEPQRAVKAAHALARVREHALDGRSQDTLPQLDALAEWTGGIAGLIQGEMADAAARFDRAAARFASLGQAHPAAQTQVPKIMALAMLGRIEEAAACGTAAREQLLALGDVAAASKVSLNLGNLFLRSDRYAGAAEHFRAAAASFARIEDHEHTVMADLGLADTLAALGSFDESARLYAHARANAARFGLPVLEVLAEESVALLELARGHYRDALAGLESVCRRYARLQMPQQLAIAEKQLADAYLELRLLPESIAGFDAALERMHALDMKIDRAWTLVQRGRALALAGRSADSHSSLFAAAGLFAEQDNAVGAAAVALARAELALARGDDGLVLAREAAAGFRDAGSLRQQLQADAVCAESSLQRGDVEAACAMFDATLQASRTHQLLASQLRCLTGRALATLAAGDRVAARRDFEAAVELFEDQRGNLPGDDLRGAFQNHHLVPFHQLLRMDLRAHEEGAVGAEVVLAQLDRLRARTLADRLNQAASDSAAQHAGTRDLRARLAWLTHRLHRQHDEAAASALLTEELRASERELLEHARRTRLGRGSATIQSGDAGFDIRQFQQALKPGDALVEYGVLDDELFACVATPEGVQLQRRLAAWPQVRDAVRAMRFQLETLRHGTAQLQRHMPTLASRALAHLQQLYRLVWQPLEGLLAGRQRVLVVPIAQLGSVPFAALHDGAQYLADRHQLAWAPSARAAFQGLSRPPATPRSVLAVGESTRLPHAAREAHAVAALLPQGRAFVGPAATLANLVSHAGGADVIHLACHAQFRADSPLFSALHLHDGALFAETIEAMRMPGTTVVLSACETALHDEGGGEEMVGLTRAFLVAGAARVLASLWPVEDAATVALMRGFYAGLLRGLNMAEALRQAQLAARQRHEHPFHWASFALSGGW